VRVLIVDGANVVGSRPDGWWRDRAGAAKRLHEAIAAADLGFDLVVLVLEGAAKRGQPVGDDGVILTADRLLRERVAAAGGSSVGPAWILTRMP
jgi:hypothetical protein